MEQVTYRWTTYDGVNLVCLFALATYNAGSGYSCEWEKQIPLQVMWEELNPLLLYFAVFLLWESGPQTYAYLQIKKH